MCLHSYCKIILMNKLSKEIRNLCNLIQISNIHFNIINIKLLSQNIIDMHCRILSISHQKNNILQHS